MLLISAASQATNMSLTVFICPGWFSRYSGDLLCWCRSFGSRLISHNCPLIDLRPPCSLQPCSPPTYPYLVFLLSTVPAVGLDLLLVRSLASGLPLIVLGRSSTSPVSCFVGRDLCPLDAASLLAAPNCTHPTSCLNIGDSFSAHTAEL